MHCLVVMAYYSLLLRCKVHAHFRVQNLCLGTFYLPRYTFSELLCSFCVQFVIFICSTVVEQMPHSLKILESIPVFLLHISFAEDLPSENCWVSFYQVRTNVVKVKTVDQALLPGWKQALKAHICHKSNLFNTVSNKKC